MPRLMHKYKLKTRIRKHHSNAKALLDLLPVEVLAKIFCFVKNRYEKEFKGRKQLGWILVSHLCLHWRNTALDCGILWSTIRTGNPDVAEWLARAGGSPLVVDLDLGTAAEETALVLVLPKLAQIRSLSIRLGASMQAKMHERIWSYLEMLYSTPAPLLEFFELEDKDGHHHDAWYFAGIAPALRRFRIDGCGSILPAPCFDDLTSLSINYALPPLNKFALLAQLRRMPSLEYLTLRNVIVPMDQPLDAIPNIPGARLLMLKEFTFLGIFFNNDLDFLSRLTFNPKTTVEFRSSMKTPDLSALSRFIEVYSQVIQDPIEFKTLVVRWDEKTLTIDASDTLLATPRPTLGLELYVPWEEDDFPTSWGEELAQLTAITLRSLDTDCRIGWSAWTLLSNESKHLTNISVSGAAAWQFVSVLFDDYKKNCPLIQLGDGRELKNLTWATIGRMLVWKKPAFYCLETLQIVDVDFLTDHGPMMIDFLQWALRERGILAKTRIQDLYITECDNFDKRMLEKFRKVVDVRWDGVDYPNKIGEVDPDWFKSDDEGSEGDRE